MGKLCARGKAAAKRKFRVYPSAYANAYAVKVCKGDVKGPEARKSFASRHNCEQKKDKTKAGYWACRAHKDFGPGVGRFW